MELICVNVNILDKRKAINWIIDQGDNVNTSELEEYFAYKGEGCTCPHVVITETRSNVKPVSPKELSKIFVEKMMKFKEA